jgi:lactoylglutathione lyase
MTAIAFAFTRLNVIDLPSEEAFYSGVFGFNAVARVSEGEGESAFDEVFLDLPNAGAAQCRLALIHYRNRPVPPPGEAVIGFMVENVAASVARVEAAKGKTTLAPLTLPEHGLQIAYVQDPEGHTIELLQKLSATKP